MAGRKRIKSELGKRRMYSFFLYPSEYQKMRIEFNKLKKLRKQYETKLPNKHDLEEE